MQAGLVDPDSRRARQHRVRTKPLPPTRVIAQPLASKRVMSRPLPPAYSARGKLRCARPCV
eukprot:3553008-Rhodomonas_salina.2